MRGAPVIDGYLKAPLGQVLFDVLGGLDDMREVEFYGIDESVAYRVVEQVSRAGNPERDDGRVLGELSALCDEYGLRPRPESIHAIRDPDVEDLCLMLLQAQVSRGISTADRVVACVAIRLEGSDDLRVDGD